MLDQYNYQMIQEQPRPSVTNPQEPSDTMVDKMLALFEELQTFQTPTRDHILNLLRLCVSDNNAFLQAIEQAYLKIFSTISSQGQTIQTKVFQSLLQSFIRELISLQIKQSILDQVQSSFQETLFFILQFLVEAAKCFISEVRLMSLRILNNVLLDLSYNLEIDFEQGLKQLLIDLVLFLLSLKSQICKQFGVKIFLALRQLQVKSAYMEQAVLQLLEEGSNQETRKLVLLNFITTKQNIDRFLCRLNDKNSQISMLLLKKLKSIQTQQYGNYHQISFENLNFDQKIKILIDGFGHPNQWVKSQCVEYFASQMKKISEQNIRILKIENSQNQIISYIYQNFDEFSNFVDQFDPQVLLTYPKFYKVFNEMLNKIMPKLPQFQKFLINLCQKIKRLSITTNSYNIQLGSEIIFLSNVLSFPNKFRSVFQQNSPSFSQFAHLLQYFVKEKNVLGMYETLQIVKNAKNSEQIGKHKLFQTLKRVLYDLNQFQSNWKNVKFSDQWQFCQNQAKQYLQYHKFIDDSDQSLCVSNSFDLILPIISAMKNIRPQYYTDQIQYMIEDWSNPESMTYFLEKDVALTALAKIQASQEQSVNKTSLLSSLNEKILTLSKKISQNNEKKIFSIISLRNMNQKWNISNYLPLMKDQLQKDNQLYGLKMVGFHCEYLQNFELFFPLFWHHVSYFQVNKLHFLLSIHIITDLSIKLQIFHNKNKGLLKLSNRQEFTDTMFIQKIIDLIRIHLQLGQSFIAKELIENLTKLIYFNTFDQNKEILCLVHLIVIFLQAQSGSQIQKAEFYHLGLFFRQYMQKNLENQKKFVQSFLILCQTLQISKSQHKYFNSQKVKIKFNFKKNFQIMLKSLFTLLDNPTQGNTKDNFNIQKKSNQNIDNIFQNLKVRDIALLFTIEKYYRFIISNNDVFKKFFVGQISNKQVQYLIFVKKHLRNGLEKQTKAKYRKELQSYDKLISNQIKIKGLHIFNEEIVEGLQSSLAYHENFLNQFAKNIYERFQIMNFWKVSETKLQESSEHSKDLAKIQEQNREQVEAQIRIKKNKYVMIPALILLSTGVLKPKRKIDPQFIPKGKSNSFMNVDKQASIESRYSTRKRERLQFQCQITLNANDIKEQLETLNIQTEKQLAKQPQNREPELSPLENHDQRKENEQNQ